MSPKQFIYIIKQFIIENWNNSTTIVTSIVIQKNERFSSKEKSLQKQFKLIKPKTITELCIIATDKTL